MVALNPAYRGPEIAGFLNVVLLVHLDQPLVGSRFEADKDADAPGPLGQSEQLLIIRHIDRRLADPLLTEICLDHRPEQIFCPSDMIPTSANEIVVHDEYVVLPNQLELCYDILD